MEVGNPKDFIAGTVFAGFGIAAIIFGHGYSVGSAENMGPGYFPLLIGIGLILMGVIIVAKSVRARREAIAAIRLQPQFFILGAILFFGLSIERFGLVAAIIGATVIGSLAAGKPRWAELLILCLALATSSVVLFVYLIGQPIPVWPR